VEPLATGGCSMAVATDKGQSHPVWLWVASRADGNPDSSCGVQQWKGLQPIPKMPPSAEGRMCSALNVVWAGNRTGNRSERVIGSTCRSEAADWCLLLAAGSTCMLHLHGLPAVLGLDAGQGCSRNFPASKVSCFLRAARCSCPPRDAMLFLVPRDAHACGPSKELVIIRPESSA
jgi:hypothetical protein